jgi:hypothetical protein
MLGVGSHAFSKAGGAASFYDRWPARRNCGRYFYFTPDDALAYAAKQDDLR